MTLPGSVGMRGVVALALAAAACGSERGDAATQRVSLVSVGEPEHLHPPPEVAVMDDDARQLVQRWETALNDGDFATYRSLYTRDMTGVLPSGRQLRRSDWMHERRRMFERGVAVTIGTPSLVDIRGGLHATFTLESRSGEQEYVGEITLVLIQEDGEVRIVEEIATPGAPGER